MTWRANTGSAPIAENEGDEPIVRVFVRLRCGIQPAMSWPVDTGRRETTRWTLIGSPFDIIEWMRV